jgi:ABC-type transporter Mla subunit MlaD
MIELLLGLGVAVFTLYAAFSIVSSISIKRTSDSMREFLMDTEGSLNSALSEFRATLENMRKISSDIREVTADIKQVSHGVADAEKVLRDRLVSLDQSLSSTVEANIAGLKAGVAAGVESIVRNAAIRKE